MKPNGVSHHSSIGMAPAEQLWSFTVQDPPSTDEQAIAAAKTGDRRAFDQLAQGAMPKLRGTIRRMIGHPQQTDDLVQDALAKAWGSIRSFDGRSAFSTWLCRIGTNLTIDFLRAEKRWREHAQIAYANECNASPELAMEVGAVLMSPSFHYDVKEHVAFCFTCVSRSLDPDLQVALVLREVEELSNQEAAKFLGLSESVFRHRLSEARSTMERSFEGLCALVNKQGVCYQCSGLRDAIPDASRQGEPAPDVLSLGRRLNIVRECDVDAGRSQGLHDLFWSRIAVHEREGRGDVRPSTDCTPPDST
ncbi:MAG: RNA polymerase sigma factor [Deltaproteobacteria bacterium]|nr:RNA polymerase sigma factor [Deltaproteobacteria bacterium]